MAATRTVSSVGQAGDVSIALALSSSLVWGVADFLGGFNTRRAPLTAVTVVSQAAGFVALLVWLAARGFHLGGTSFALGLVAGIGGAIGLSAFYKALAVGTMSIVSPVTACGAVVPFALALARGERPSTWALLGALVALVGAVLASAAEGRAAGGRRLGALLAVVAALAIGLFTYFLGLGGKHGDPFASLFGARVGSLSLLVLGALALRAPLAPSRALLWPVALVGLLDSSANALFVFASRGGYLSVVSVLGSLYPVVTLLAAHVFLHERLTVAQRGGVVLALVGVCVVAAAS
jgi:drug/metabolite transporter (DMT)-like permease